MSAAFVQSLSKNFINLKGGLEKSYTKLNSLYQDTATKETCSVDNATILRIIAQLRTMTRIINSILSVVQKLLKFTSFLQTIIIAMSILIKVLKFLPIPAQFSTVGVIVTMGDLLAKIDQIVNVALITVTGINFVVNFIQISLSLLLGQISKLLTTLLAFSGNIKDCSTDKNELSQILNNSIQDVQGAIVGLNLELGELTKTSDSYKGFTFQIIEEEVVDEGIEAKRRYAIALNTNGIMVLRGVLTYATDKQVLIDELKLIIDSQNLTGYPSFDENQSDKAIENSYNLPSNDEILQNSNDSKDKLDKYINSNTNLQKLKDSYN